MKNSNHVTDRRASSAKRDSDVLEFKTPVISKTAYDQAFSKADSMNPKMRALCLGRIRIGHALTAVDKAIHDWSPEINGDGRDKKTKLKLRSIRDALEKAYVRYPLEVVK